MPRNVDENVYVTIGFARGSPTWQQLHQLERIASQLEELALHAVLQPGSNCNAKPKTWTSLSHT